MSVRKGVAVSEGVFLGGILGGVLGKLIGLCLWRGRLTCRESLGIRLFAIRVRLFFKKIRAFARMCKGDVTRLCCLIQAAL